MIDNRANILRIFSHFLGLLHLQTLSLIMHTSACGVWHSVASWVLWMSLRFGSLDVSLVSMQPTCAHHKYWIVLTICLHALNPDMFTVANIVVHPPFVQAMSTRHSIPSMRLESSTASRGISALLASSCIGMPSFSSTISTTYSM